MFLKPLLEFVMKFKSQTWLARQTLDDLGGVGLDEVDFVFVANNFVCSLWPQSQNLFL